MVAYPILQKARLSQKNIRVRQREGSAYKGERRCEEGEDAYRAGPKSSPTSRPVFFPPCCSLASISWSPGSWGRRAVAPSDSRAELAIIGMHFLFSLVHVTVLSRVCLTNHFPSRIFSLSNSGVPFQARDEKGIPFKPEAAPQLYMVFGSSATVAPGHGKATNM